MSDGLKNWLSVTFALEPYMDEEGSMHSMRGILPRKSDEVSLDRVVEIGHYSYLDLKAPIWY